ncbi:MAG: tRNA (adenine(22)-N(1))-methyltransferase TrmK [Gammaproteobacteria bacterium]|nr:tRNA (adenine(22)-N(1))-methyltransferase TrmK [Gammaproteobacteria bacterium]
MAFQRLFRIAFCFTLYTSSAIPINTFAEDNEYYSTWELQHSGKYRLVWYYAAKKDFDNNQPNKVLVHDKEFLIRPDVRPPTINGIYLLEYSRVKEGEEVLDIGTGSGIHAIFAAEKAIHVVATDIYPPAIENAKTNAQLHSVDHKIDFRVGDLFAPLNDREKFDVVFFNINFPFSAGDNERNRLHERFFSEVRKYMKPDARIYYQTSFVKNIPYIYDMLNRNGFRIMEMHMEHMLPYRHEPLFMMIQSH